MCWMLLGPRSSHDWTHIVTTDGSGDAINRQRDYFAKVYDFRIVAIVRPKPDALVFYRG